MYKFCKQTLEWKKLSLFKIATVLLLLIFFSSFTSYMVGASGKVKYVEHEREQLVMILNDKENEAFSPQALWNYMKEINMQFPDIVFAQAVLESGNFNSKIFRSNHNLFGMREAGRRIKTCKGTELNHAYYDNWKESVLDYAFYQAYYLDDIKTKEMYLTYLDNNYAESGNYRKTVEDVINANKFNIIK